MSVSTSYPSLSCVSILARSELTWEHRRSANDPYLMSIPVIKSSESDLTEKLKNLCQSFQIRQQ